MTKPKDPKDLKKRGRPPKNKVTDPETAPAIAAEIIDDQAQQPAGELIVRDQDPAAEAAASEAAGREAALSIVGGISTTELARALDVQTEQRALIQKFIQDNLVVDVDYGKIHVVKSCPAENNQRGSCDRDYHYSKSILFKPGQEKIFSLFGITDELVKDDDAYEMLPGVKDLVAYKCIMWRGKNKVGEGRGAATLSGTQGDPNATIKKAEKRARMDGCLSLGFSAYFTQDLDDPEYKSQREMMIEKARNEAERRDKDDLGLWKRPAEEPIDNEERAMLFAAIQKAGYKEPDVMLDLLKANGVQDPKGLKSGEARDLIRKFRTGDYTPIAQPAPAEPDEVIEDIPDTITADDLPDPEPEEPELVVDDDLKNYIVGKIQNLGLTNRGQMWLYQRICGRPFAKFDKMTDQEWKKAYDIVLQIEDNTYDIPDEYVAGLIVDDEPEVKDPSEPANQPDKDDQQLNTVQELFPGAEVIGGQGAGNTAKPETT